MGQVPSDIKKNIEHAIREGVGQEYLGIVKELKNTYYLEDVAAAAIAMYTKQGEQQEQRVQRRTLANASSLPFKTMEAKGTGEREKPAFPPVRPSTARKEPSVQRGHGGHQVAGGHDGRTGQPGKGQPRDGQPRGSQPRRSQSSDSQSRGSQSRGSQSRDGQTRSNQPQSRQSRDNQPRKNQRR